MSLYLLCMPSQITHFLFGLKSAESASIPIHDPAWFALGCQGPDIFLHNQRTKPFSLSWGKALHRRNVGRFSAVLLSFMKKHGWNYRSAPGSYTAGFITHGILDRAAHPYIVNRAGWGNEHRFFHQFLERLIDVELQKHPCCFSHEQVFPEKASFIALLDPQPRIPEEMAELLAASVRLHFTPPMTDREISLRIANAYSDTMHFLARTDRFDLESIGKIVNFENPVRRNRLLTLFHPPEVPDYLDVLNLSRRVWVHPWDREQTSRQSFPEIFLGASALAAESLRLSEAALASDDDPCETGLFADPSSNHSLDTGLPFSPLASPAASDPLPLARFLDELAARYQTPTSE